MEYYSLHEGTNLSFHSPIILTLHINVEYSSCHTTTNIPKPKRQESTNHDAVRALRLDQHQLHRQKVSQALLANKSSDFWKEIRKVKGNGDALPSVIDNMSNDEDISDLFAKKYDQLYNSVSFDQNNMSILKDKIVELIDETPMPTLT